MQNMLSVENQTLNFYFIKQNKFKTLVKNVQHTLKTKVYKKEGLSLEEYVKMKWNISKAQAYRFMISAKVIDQLEEFQIQPSYERLCRSLSTYAKTPEQMRLLWGAILNRTHNKPESINSFYVGKVWKELCMDSRYKHICHYEEEIMSKIEESFQKYTKTKKLKQMKENLKKCNQPVPYNINTNVYTSPAISDANVYTSPALSETTVYTSPNINNQNINKTNVYTSPSMSNANIYTSPAISNANVYTSPALSETTVYTSPVINDKNNNVYNINGMVNKNENNYVTYSINNDQLINNQIIISPKDTKITTYPVVSEVKVNYISNTPTTYQNIQNTPTFQNVYLNNNLNQIQPIVNNVNTNFYYVNN